MTVFVIFMASCMAAVAGLMAVMIIRSGLVARRLKQVFFEATAKRLKGVHVRGGMFSRNRIECEIARRPALVEFEPSDQRSPGKTTVRVLLREPSPGTLHILREGGGYEFLKLFGAQDISVGDADFDREFVVKAMPESLAARVFSPERRDRVIAAVRRFPGGDPAIELTRNQLRVQVGIELLAEGGVATMVRTAQEFLEFLAAPGSAGGIELGDVKFVADSVCPVCGTTLAGLSVRCDSCKTPHHVECWTYVGRCSTYACKGRRIVA